MIHAPMFSPPANMVCTRNTNGTCLPQGHPQPLLPDHNVRLREIHVHRGLVRWAERARCEPARRRRRRAKVSPACTRSTSRAVVPSLLLPPTSITTICPVTFTDTNLQARANHKNAGDVGWRNSCGSRVKRDLAAKQFALKLCILRDDLLILSV